MEANATACPLGWPYRRAPPRGSDPARGFRNSTRSPGKRPRLLAADSGEEGPRLEQRGRAARPLPGRSCYRLMEPKDGIRPKSEWPGGFDVLGVLGGSGGGGSTYPTGAAPVAAQSISPASPLQGRSSGAPVQGAGLGGSGGGGSSSGSLLLEDARLSSGVAPVSSSTRASAGGGGGGFLCRGSRIAGGARACARGTCWPGAGGGGGALASERAGGDSGGGAASAA